MALVSSAISAAVSRTPRLPRLRYAPGVPLRCGHRSASADLPSRCGPDTVHSAHAHHRTTRHSRCTPHALADLHAVLLHRSGVDGHRGRRMPSRGRFGAFWRLDWAHFKRFRGIWWVAEAGNRRRFASRAAIMAAPVRVERGHGSAASRPSAAIGAVMSCPPPRAAPTPGRSRRRPSRRPDTGAPSTPAVRTISTHAPAAPCRAPCAALPRRPSHRPASRCRCRPQARPRILPGPRGCARHRRCAAMPRASVRIHTDEPRSRRAPEIGA